MDGLVKLLILDVPGLEQPIRLYKQNADDGETSQDDYSSNEMIGHRLKNIPKDK